MPTNTPDPQIVCGHAQVARAFEEWLRCYRANPEQFDREFAQVGSPAEYGQKAASYFVRLLGEVA